MYVPVPVGETETLHYHQRCSTAVPPTEGFRRKQIPAQEAHLWQQVQHCCLSVTVPFWEVPFVFSCITLNYGALEIYQGISSSVSFFIPFHVMQEAKQEEKILFCSLEVIEGVYTSYSPQEETVEILCRPILGLHYNSFNCFKLTVVILLKLSPSSLRTGASFFIFLALIFICSIMRQKNINKEGCCY